MQLANFAIFFKLRWLLNSSKAQQKSRVFQHWRTLWQVTKTIKFTSHRVVLLHLIMPLWQVVLLYDIMTFRYIIPKLNEN